MGIISDQMFTKNLQYLIDEKIILVVDNRTNELGWIFNHYKFCNSNYHFISFSGFEFRMNNKKWRVTLQLIFLFMGFSN